MVAKDNPVIDLVEEEEEEERPEVGVQNIEEAEQYTQKINNVFDHLSALIHQDTKTALAQTIQNFKIVVKQWQSMGDANVDVILRTIKDPDGTVSMTAFDGRGHRGGGPPRRVTIRSRVHEAATRMGQAGRGGGIHNRYFQPCSTSTRAPLRGVRKHRCPHQSDR